MNCPNCHKSPTPLKPINYVVHTNYLMSPQPLNPISVTAQAENRENWAAARTRHLANHPQERRNKTSIKSI